MQPLILPPEFWTRERELLKAELLPSIEILALIGAANAGKKLGEIGISTDHSLVLNEAAKWARTYTDQLLEQLGTTNEKVVGELVANWAETPGATLHSLQGKLTPILRDNELRAQTIAVTETTRAIAGGEAVVYEQAGIGRLLIAPPAHVRCRCFTRATMFKGDVVIVWQSSNDEAAECNNPISTPWGQTIIGCRNMTGYVISEGENLGKRVR